MRLVSVYHSRLVVHLFSDICPPKRLLLSEQLTDAPTGIATSSSPLTNRQPVALGEGSGPHGPGFSGDKSGGDGGGGLSDEDALQARLDALRRG
jgi:charged multivesicular body protein 2A